MLGTASTAAVWGGAVPMAGNAAGLSPGEAYDAATPSPIESAGLGLMFAGHSTGLQSGGLIGYSTFFTGYNEEMNGMARRLSLGRLAAQGVSLAARGLNATPLGGTAFGKNYLQPLTRFHRYGAGVFDTRAARQVANLPYANLPGRGHGIARAATQPYAPLQNAASDVTDNLAASTKRIADEDLLTMNVGQIDDMARAGARGQLQAALKQATVEGPGGRSSTFRYAVGVAGGRGYTNTGKKAVREVFDEDLQRYVPVAQKGSKGATVMKGRLGSLIGKSFRFAGYLEAARLITDGVTYAAGEAYQGLVDTARALDQRTGSSYSMSPGYYNRAAATERQRAIQTLNSTALNPRTQIMGNEAGMYH